MILICKFCIISESLHLSGEKDANGYESDLSFKPLKVEDDWRSSGQRYKFLENVESGCST